MTKMELTIKENHQVNEIRPDIVAIHQDLSRWSMALKETYLIERSRSHCSSMKPESCARIGLGSENDN